MTLDQAFDAGLLIDEAGRPIVSRKQLADAKWITVHPNGAGSKGTPVQISENGTVLAGMGGKFNGKKLGELKGGSAASQHIEKTLSASAERIRQSVPSKLKETPEQRQTIEHYVAKHQAAERAILEKFHRERENNPGWSVTGRSGRKISNTATPLENLARESQTLKSIESEMVTKLESMRPASSVTASEHTKLSNNVTRSVVGLFAGTHSKSEASAAIKALATANPSKLSERLVDIEKSLKSRGSSLESLFGKSGASASLIKRHLNGSGGSAASIEGSAAQNKTQTNPSGVKLNKNQNSIVNKINHLIGVDITKAIEPRFTKGNRIQIHKSELPNNALNQIERISNQYGGFTVQEGGAGQISLAYVKQ